ncbi:MAG TPA: hypothetical protein VEK14_03660 [Rhodomicrobium sp.]|nr:hypothetical protein [Rhodomicrobium sp.]
MTAIFTRDNLADYVAAFRARVEQRRKAIDKRPSKKIGALSAVSEASKDFWEGVLNVRALSAQRHAFQGVTRAYDAKDNDALIYECNRAIDRLGRDWIESARRGNVAAVRALLEEGFPITYHDRLTGETALHAAAGSQARPVVRLLLPIWPDFLIRDGQGRLASEVAYLYGQDPALSRLLAIKEQKQHDAKPVKSGPLKRRANPHEYEPPPEDE